jgi:hypothetical protein
MRPGLSVRSTSQSDHERGEFHTFCHRCPEFSTEIPRHVEREGFWFADIRESEDTLPDLVQCNSAKDSIETRFIADQFMEQGIPVIADKLEVAGDSSNAHAGEVTGLSPFITRECGAEVDDAEGNLSVVVRVRLRAPIGFL